MLTFIKAALGILPEIVGGISDSFKAKRELKKVEVQGEIDLKKAISDSNIKLALNGQAHDIKWEQTMAEASATSWKDEYWTIVLSIPAVLSFVPGMVQYVVEGFTALSGTPVWYQGLLVMAISAAFGLKIREKIKAQ